jgi:UDP-GlcNAc:undecaprenyl-phosphate GlcNAc-1-phosphate transferase
VTYSAFFAHGGFFLALMALSAIMTLLMARRVRILDVPNHRSSHSVPTPKSGGVAIVLTFLVGNLCVFFIAEITRIQNFHFFGFLICGLILAVVSFIDDITQKSFFFKLGAQMICAGFVLIANLVIRHVNIPVIGIFELGWLAYPLTFIWLMGLINSYNFMDGLDGLAAGVAVIAAGFLASLAFREQSYFVYMASLILAASAAGFLVFNISPAKIFMGDVGSAFIGFSFAMLAVIGSSYDRGHLNFFLVPLLLFNFIFDTAFTFFRRFLNGEKAYLPHRTHLYQLLNRVGYSHRQVSLFYYAVAIVQGLAAWVLIGLQSQYRPWVFVPFLLFNFAFAFWVLARARAHGLVPLPDR